MTQFIKDQMIDILTKMASKEHKKMLLSDSVSDIDAGNMHHANHHAIYCNTNVLVYYIINYIDLRSYNSQSQSKSTYLG